MYVQVCVCEVGQNKIPDLNFIPEESKSLFQVSAHLEAPTAADTHQRPSNSPQLQQVQ